MKVRPGPGLGAYLGEMIQKTDYSGPRVYIQASGTDWSTIGSYSIRPHPPAPGSDDPDYWVVPFTYPDDMTEDLCVMLCCEASGDVLGGRSIMVWINGVKRLDCFRLSAAQVMAPGPIFKREYTDDHMNGYAEMVWIGAGALDPAEWFGAFFDAEGQVLTLPEGGEVGGVAPAFWQMGAASAWNSGIDRNGNPYTITGAVTGGAEPEVGEAVALWGDSMARSPLRGSASRPTTATARISPRREAKLRACGGPLLREEDPASQFVVDQQDHHHEASVTRMGVADANVSKRVQSGRADDGLAGV